MHILHRFMHFQIYAFGNHPMSRFPDVASKRTFHEEGVSELATQQTSTVYSRLYFFLLYFRTRLYFPNLVCPPLPTDNVRTAISPFSYNVRTVRHAHTSNVHTVPSVAYVQYRYLIQCSKHTQGYWYHTLPYSATYSVLP